MKSAAFIVVAALVFPSVALADPTKRECIDANADAQTQQKVGKLRAAQTALRLCSNSACPGTVKDDCAQRLDALSALVPSLVFGVKNGDGADISAVKVTMDGQTLVEKLDGNPIELDPGEYSFTFETAGVPALTKSIVVRQGERARRESIVLGEPTTAPAPPPAPVAVAPQPPPPEVEKGGSTQKTLGIVAGAAGIAGVGAGVVLGVLANSKWSDAKDACSTTTCPNRSVAEDTRQSALGLATGSTIAFIAGGVLVAGGVVLWLTAPSSSARVGFAPTPSGGLFSGTF